MCPMPYFRRPGHIFIGMPTTMWRQRYSGDLTLHYNLTQYDSSKEFSVVLPQCPPGKANLARVLVKVTEHVEPDNTLRGSR